MKVRNELDSIFSAVDSIGQNPMAVSGQYFGTDMRAEQNDLLH